MTRINLHCTFFNNCFKKKIFHQILNENCIQTQILYQSIHNYNTQLYNIFF